MSNSFVGLSSVTLVADNDYFGLDNFIVDVAKVSEPAPLALLGLGLAGIAFSHKRKSN